MRIKSLGALAVVVLFPACYDFHFVGPENPPALKSPATVAVSVVYLRPTECVIAGDGCDGPVTFQASWMNLGAYVTLQQSGAHTWVATVPDVPVNFPRGDPHRVYAVDPYLIHTATAGVSADRLTIGGERIVRFEKEQGLIFIDANGKGRTP